jgi:rhodanese-related sulfurtransferase
MSKKPTTAKGRKPSSSPHLPTTAIIAGVVVLAAIVVAAILLLQKPSGVQPLPAEVSPAEAAAMKDTGAVLLDVREQSEWDAGHVSGATLIPLGELATRMSELPKDKDIVVMCRTGVRSAKGRDALLQAGFARVTSVKGGITAWSSGGLPTTSGN